MLNHQSLILDAAKRDYSSRTGSLSLKEKIINASTLKFNLGITYFAALSILVIKMFF